MMSPNGELLCTCNKKKIDWYLEKGLADMIADDPPTIQLKFEPAGKGHAGDPFYLSPKENRCVVCGTNENYIRHSVVPHAYRSLLDESYKGRSSHDIVLLCPKCSQKTNQCDGLLRAQLAKDLKAPLNGLGVRFIVDDKLLKVKNLARTLSTDRKTIPAPRLQQLEQTLKEFLGRDTIEQEDIDDLKDKECRVSNPDFKSHEELVVETLQTEEEVAHFIKQWREHFVNNMKPKYLPSYWSVDHSI